jgi:crotonobetaine/carnitine-CoA ligase
VVRSPYPSAFSSGYLDDPDATSRVWRNGWFHSGDAFRTDDSGWFYLVDRFKDSLRRRGENVSSFEVEAVVGSYEGVSECAAVGVPGEHGDDDIVVFLIPTSPGAVSASDLREWVSKRLPSHMNPTKYRIVEELPRNATTLRVKKHELRRMASDS